MTLCGVTKEAYEWDKTKNPEMMRVFHKLTDDHINVSDSAKMRNYLAEDCLSKEMLNLMTLYQKNVPDGKYLNGSIEILKNGQMVSIFNDDRPLTDESDTRINTLRSVKNWFKAWQKDVNSKNTLTAADKKKMLISYETMEDVRFCITGFEQICKARVRTGFSVLPSRMNSDIVENFFCQQRARNGDNNNPTYLQYTKNINTITLGQCSKGRARKSNVGLKGAEPYNFSKPKSMRL